MKEDIISEALNLNEMIDYQKDSVVSRTLIKKRQAPLRYLPLIWDKH